MRYVTYTGIFIAAAFIAGAFVASPELRAFAANTVGSADIIDGSIQSVDIGNGQVKAADLGSSSVTAAKIKDGEVKAAEIATDSVGANEILGVTKLLFEECSGVPVESVPPGGFDGVDCAVFGAAVGNEVMVTKRAGNNCMVISNAFVSIANTVHIDVRNVCNVNNTAASSSFSIIVYDT